MGPAGGRIQPTFPPPFSPPPYWWIEQRYLRANDVIQMTWNDLIWFNSIPSRRLRFRSAWVSALNAKSIPNAAFEIVVVVESQVSKRVSKWVSKHHSTCYQKLDSLSLLLLMLICWAHDSCGRYRISEPLSTGTSFPPFPAASFARAQIESDLAFDEEFDSARQK